MKQKSSITSLIIVISIFVLANACKKDDTGTPVCDGSMPTYEVEIQSILNEYCTNLACHGLGSIYGDFTSYNGISGNLFNGSFERQVLIDKTMPRGSSFLTQAELNLIRCWADNNYPRN